MRDRWVHYDESGKLVVTGWSVGPSLVTRELNRGEKLLWFLFRKRPRL